MDHQFNETRNHAFICEVTRKRSVLIKQKNPMKNRKKDVPIDNISHDCFQLEKSDNSSKSG